MRIIARAALAAVIVAGGLALGPGRPARAAGAPSVVPAAPWGYLWADQQAAPPTTYTPSTFYQFTSLDGEHSTVLHDGTGAYRVTFAGLAASGGTVQVTAYDSGSPAWCRVNGWGQFLSDEFALIDCYGPGGAGVNTRFDATFTRPGSGVQGRYGYVWNDRAAAALHRRYVPDRSVQFNSARASDTIVREGTGRYTVTLPRLGAAGGLALVTSFFTGGSSTPAFCKPRAWAPAGTAETIDVRCYDPAGHPVNSLFTMTYENRADALATGWGGGYVLADRPAAASYAPADSWNQFGGANHVFHRGAGLYRVDMEFMAVRGGDVQVSAAGNGDTRCYSQGWFYGSVTEGMDVACVNSAGQPADSPFALSFVRGPAVP
jgi:hypothetical protein